MLFGFFSGRKSFKHKKINYINLHMLIKQKSLSLPRNLSLGTFDELLIVLSTKTNLLYLLYSMAWGCCLLHLIKQNSLLKTFLRTLILKSQVSPCLLFLLELIWNCILHPKLPRQLKRLKWTLIYERCVVLIIFSLVVPVFKNVEERSTTKSHHPVSLLSVVSKVWKSCK